MKYINMTNPERAFSRVHHWRSTQRPIGQCYAPIGHWWRWLLTFLGFVSISPEMSHLSTTWSLFFCCFWCFQIFCRKSKICNKMWFEIKLNLKGTLLFMDLEKIIWFQDSILILVSCSPADLTLAFPGLDLALIWIAFGPPSADAIVGIVIVAP